MVIHIHVVRRPAPCLQKLINDSVTYVRTLPEFVFSTLAGLCYPDQPDGSVRLRSNTISTMLKGIAYNHNESFAKLQKHPWSLTQGDLWQNIADLRSAEGVTDLAARKFQRELICNPGSDFAVHQSLLLLRDAAATTGLGHWAPPQKFQ